jgi:hypothetical protein
MAVWFGLQKLEHVGVWGELPGLLSHFRDFFAWQFGGLVWSAKNLNKLAL